MLQNLMTEQIHNNNSHKKEMCMTLIFDYALFLVFEALDITTGAFWSFIFESHWKTQVSSLITFPKCMG